MRAGVATAAKWFVGTAIVFGFIGKGCSALDSEQMDITYKQSLGKPRVILSHWEPDKPIPVDQTLPFSHVAYRVALKHRETLVWSSPDEEGTGTLSMRNTTSFPFLTEQWSWPWPNN